MPSTIPYDPSLVLGNVVSLDSIAVVKEISAAQAPADAAQENFNALLISRRSLDMTKTEISNLGISTKDVDKALGKLNDDIAAAAGEYCTAKAAAEEVIKGLRAKIQSVHSQAESSVDFIGSQIKQLPLSSDTMTMDVQYFSNDTNKQDSGSFASSISSFVSQSTQVVALGKAAAQVSAAAQSQVSSQTQQHSIMGTLVLSVSCTHKTASILAPLILNVDKGIKA